jgi:SNF family Na+-dependent transporter
MVNVVGTNWLGFFNDLQGTWMLPIGALGIALFVGWRIPSDVRETGFKAGSSFQWLYPGWVFILRFVIPIGLAAILILNAYELITTDVAEELYDETEAVEVMEENGIATGIDSVRDE